MSTGIPNFLYSVALGLQEREDAGRPDTEVVVLVRTANGKAQLITGCNPEEAPEVVCRKTLALLTEAVSYLTDPKTPIHRITPAADGEVKSETITNTPASKLH